MKKILQAILILWISLPLLMEAMTALTNLENYKLYVAWYTNRMYRSNTYYYIAAAIEIILVFLIFIDVKRKALLYTGLGIITAWHIAKFAMLESDRGLSYYYLTVNTSKVQYWGILSAYLVIGGLLFYFSYYRNRSNTL